MNNKPELGKKAMSELVFFVLDMATEHKGGNWLDRKCPIMTAHEEKLGDIKKMIAEGMNPMTTI